MAQPNFETVVTNGIQLRVALAGKGPLVLLVHGWPGIQRRPLDRFQQLWPSDAELAHDADVEIDDDLPDSRIECRSAPNTDPLKARASAKPSGATLRCAPPALALRRHNLEGGQLFDADPGQQFGAV